LREVKRFVRRILRECPSDGKALLLLTAVVPKEQVCHSEARFRAEESLRDAAQEARFFASLRMTNFSLPWPFTLNRRPPLT
jgi:hypothetical protein